MRARWIIWNGPSEIKAWDSFILILNFQCVGVAEERNIKRASGLIRQHVSNKAWFLLEWLSNVHSELQAIFLYIRHNFIQGHEFNLTDPLWMDLTRFLNGSVSTFWTTLSPPVFKVTIILTPNTYQQRKREIKIGTFLRGFEKLSSKKFVYIGFKTEKQTILWYLSL